MKSVFVVTPLNKRGVEVYGIWGSGEANEVHLYNTATDGLLKSTRTTSSQF